MISAVAPGRVNLIGDHTDYTGGLVFPMAIDLVTVVEGEPGGVSVDLRSAQFPESASVPLDVGDPSTVTPSWARYVAGVIAELRPATGFIGSVRSTVPTGSGLSSSAALEVATALALGFRGTPLELARLCQRAEHRSVGVPSGIMDQLASAAGVAGHALLIDCHTCAVEPVPLDENLDVVVIHSGQERTLAGSAYGERVAQCQAAEAVIGPLRLAAVADVDRIDDPLVRRRARHVVGENERVRQFAAALRAKDHDTAGALMDDSHFSLAHDYDVSTEVLDDLCRRLRHRDGVYGARLTGAGFGGCVVALAERGALSEGWVVHPADGARLIEL
jgi:galactokinase